MTVPISRNVRAALEGRRGRLLLIQSVIHPGNEPDLARQVDLGRLAMTGGPERTEAAFASRRS